MYGIRAEYIDSYIQDILQKLLINANPLNEMPKAENFSLISLLLMEKIQ
jgi:hypothetical protein